MSVEMSRGEAGSASPLSSFGVLSLELTREELRLREKVALDRVLPSQRMNEVRLLHFSDALVRGFANTRPHKTSLPLNVIFR